MYARIPLCLGGILLVSLLLGWARAEGAEIPTPAVLMEKYGLRPGMKITGENAHLIKDLVPEAFYRRVEKGEYALTIGMFDPPDALTKVWHEEYYQAVERNAGKYDVDEDGGIIDKEGKRPWPMPFGLPFPNIDFEKEDRKKVGAKILWNSFSNLGSIGDFDLLGVSPLASFAHGARSPDRYAGVTSARQFVDFRPDPITINRPLVYQDIFLFLAPSDAFGTASLTWRWVDPKKWDSVWGYSPSTRRIRRLTSANRSDSSLGTEFIQDDANGYNGKIEMFEWKYVGAQAVLLSFYRLKGEAPEDYVVKLPREAEPAGGRFAQLPTAFQQTPREWKFGFQETPQRYASWWPLTELWVPVWAHIVEGNPKDPYYNYGRQIFWYEANTFAAGWKLIYNRSGEYWRTTFITPEWNRYNVEGKPRVIYDLNQNVTVDERTNRATVGVATTEDVLVRGLIGTRVWNAGHDPELFTLGRLLGYGK